MNIFEHAIDIFVLKLYFKQMKQHTKSAFWFFWLLQTKFKLVNWVAYGRRKNERNYFNQ